MIRHSPGLTPAAAAARTTAIAKINDRLAAPRRALRGGLAAGEELIALGFDGSTSGSSLVITVQRTDGRVYQLEFKPDLETVGHAVDRAIRENA